MGSFFGKYFLSPPSPRNAAAFIDGGFSVVELQRARGRFSFAASALTTFPEGLVTPAFDTQNIREPAELKSIILQTVEAAGLAHKKRWSVALPEGVARTLVVTLESKPARRRELAEVLAWKIERAIAVPASDVRISRQQIKTAGGELRFLVTVARESVLSEYEELLSAVGWQAGLVLPRHLGEVQWLLWDESPADKILVSANQTGFVTIILQGGAPALVRANVCEADARLDELYRLGLYYRDKMARSESGLERALIIGDIDPSEASRMIEESTGYRTGMVDPVEFGFDLRDQGVQFADIAGAAGLASVAWQ